MLLWYICCTTVCREFIPRVSGKFMHRVRANHGDHIMDHLGFVLLELGVQTANLVPWEFL